MTYFSKITESYDRVYAPRLMKNPIRRIGLIALIILALALTIYSMPGVFSTISFSAALLAALFIFIFFNVKNVKGQPPVSVLALIIIVPFLLGTIIVVEGMSSWTYFLQIFVAWGLTITFWFNFLMTPLAVYHARLEEKRKRETFIYPPLTVIVPAYNEEKVIAATIEALLEADYPAPKEIIVVDDGSTDKTFEIAGRYASRGVKVFKKPNGGKSSAINFGLLFSRNPIIVTVDADTIIGINALKEIVKPLKNPGVAAVAGNVLVLNKINLLTKCQALEYIISINIVRRAMDIFGIVPVVPGVLGVFRREVIESMGNYDPDTLTEDFDITIKSLKAGKIVQSSSEAVAFTEAPETVKDLYRQRLRWYRGNVQTIRKHRDISSVKRYGMLRTLAYPFILLNLFIIPFLTIPVWLAAALTAFAGYWQEVAIILMLFITLQALHSALAIDLAGEERADLLIYSPLLVIGYKHLIDFFVVKAVIDHFRRGRKEWSRARRYGRLAKQVSPELRSELV